MGNTKKLYAIEELAEIAQKLRLEGKSIVMCHGMFDLLHLGHVRHLQRAKNEGDVLFVTVTADKFSRKGPGRPVFSDVLRVEALAALNCVDYVAISYADTAENALEALKPTVYAKGSDYKNASDDISGKIISEQKIAEENGGRIHFTDELTFSSSNILNRHFGIFPEDTDQYLRQLREEHTFEEISSELDKVKKSRVLVIGEAIIDRYAFVSPLGQSGKSTALSVRHKFVEDYAGGALAVANHIAAFSHDVTLFTTLGQKVDEGKDYEEFMRTNLQPNIEAKFVLCQKSQNIIKERFVDSDSLSKLFEVYHFDEESQITEDEEVEICSWLENKLSDFEVVVVPDYGNGMITEKMVQIISKYSPFLAVNTQINSGNRGYHVVTRYPKADFICLNEPELWLATHNRYEKTGILASQILAKLHAHWIVVTQGSKGLVSLSNTTPGDLHSVPALSSKVVDRVGAGDAFLSLCSICLAAGISQNLSTFIGAAAAALEVQIVGNQKTVRRESLLQYMSVLLK